MALATLSIDLVAKLAQFEADMGKATRLSQKAANDMERAFGPVKGLLAGLGATVSVGGIIAIGKAALNSVDAFNDLRDATGASIENISALEDVAARTGTSMDTVGTSLVKFNAALKGAKAGSEAEAAFKALGLSVKELQALDPAEALLKTATALSQFADDGNKARLTQELFGKSLREVAPFLKDLADKGQLVATVTTAQAQAAEDFNKQLFDFQKSSQDAARGLLMDLLPALSQIASELSVGIEKSGGFLNAILLLGTTNPFKTLTENVATYRSEIATLEADKARYLKSGSDTRAIDEALAAARKRLAYFEELRRVQNAKLPAAGDQTSAEDARLGITQRKSVGALPESSKKPKAEQITDEQSALAAYVKTLQSQLETAQKLTNEEKAQTFLRSIGTAGQIPQVRELVLGLAAQADALKQADESQKMLNESRKAAEAYLGSLEKENDAQAESNEQLRRHMEEIGLTKEALNQLVLKRLDDAIATQEQTRAQMNLQNSSEEEIAAMERKIQLLKEKRGLMSGTQIAQAQSDAKDEADKASKDYADTLRNDLKGAFSAAFRDSTGDPLKAFGDALANVLYSRAATALADAMLGSASGGGGISLMKLLGFDGGGYTGSGPRAGGVDGKGGFLAVMHPQETVIDHTKGQTSGGGSTIVNNNYFTVGDVASVSMVQKAIAGSERRIAGAMGRSMQYGGALA